MDNDVNEKGQRILKAFDMVQGWCSKAVMIFIYMLPLFSLSASLYYGTRQLRGVNVGNRFSICLELFLVFTTVAAIAALFSAILHKVHKKDFDFDPASMALPERGAVSLETALHQMAIKTGVIAWDTLFIILLILMLLCLVPPRVNRPLVLVICTVLAVLLAAGHIFFSRRWEKRLFAGRLLNITQKYIPLNNPGAYAAALESSLMQGPLYYSRELILTEDFIIGILEPDTRFLPVAVPRAEIAEITFYFKSPVTNPHRKYDSGILRCRMHGNRAVELSIGQASRPMRVLKVLNYYHIAWKEGETIYT